MYEHPTPINETERRLTEVRPATPADAEAIYDVQRQSWLATYPNAERGITKEDIRIKIEGEHGELKDQIIQKWRKRIEGGVEQRAVFVAQDRDEVVGFVAPVVRNDQRRIGAIYLLPEAQGKGIGKQLLERAIEWHGRDDDIYLHVIAYNDNAITFYERNGFVQTDAEVNDNAAQLPGGKSMPEIEMVLRAQTT
jgi:Predicted P-loop ATPase fused to an acetyltransferase